MKNSIGKNKILEFLVSSKRDRMWDRENLFEKMKSNKEFIDTTKEDFQNLFKEIIDCEDTYISSKSISSIVDKRNETSNTESDIAIKANDNTSAFLLRDGFVDKKSL